MGSEYLEMMIEGEKEVPEGDLVEVVEEVSRQVDRATEIIQRLRDFGRKSGYSRERIDVNQPIRAVLDILGKQLELQNIDVRLDLDPEVPVILAHPNRLEQVIFNLLTNARDALNMKGEAGAEGDGRYVRIRTFCQDGRAMVSVTDNGAGIPDAVKSNIFEAFFTTKEMGEGMGLGLSISNGIVEDYGGQIVLESREGEGTTFTLSFPAAV
jgi:signal transduction histidine kinase